MSTMGDQDAALRRADGGPTAGHVLTPAAGG
jgi:hypothetical protein